MRYVFCSPMINNMEVVSDTFIEQYKDKVKEVTRKGFMPREVTMKNGDVYLFMTVRYYEDEFVKGRRKGTDYIDLTFVSGKLYQENLLDEDYSDLVSRAVTIRALREYADTKCATGEIELANGILKAVSFLEDLDNIPTALNLSKTIELLEARRKAIIYKMNEEPYGSNVQMWYHTGVRDSIDVVTECSIKGGEEQNG